MTDKLEPVRPRIVIDETEGPGGTPLQQCFFMSTDLEGTYNIYDSEARLLAAYIVSGADFNLTVNNVHFFIYKFEIDDNAASGSWRIGHHKHAPGADDLEQDGGTFQASSGPGVPTGGDVESVSAEPPPGAIVINLVRGTSDKDKLKGMYFLPVPNNPGPTPTYNLYNKKGKWIETGIQSGIIFTFQHDSYTTGGGQSVKIVWTVTDFLITPEAASGNWTNTDQSITAEPESGSFQASSGPGAEEEEAASAASA